jgi:uncharacterized protein with HEPN domain
MSPQSRDANRMRHMRDAAVKAVSFVADKSRRELDEDEKLSLALVRLVEIIGEAASKVSLEAQTRHSNIQWRDIIGTRNQLIHAYEAVNLDILWKIVREDLPPLITLLQRAISDETSIDEG